MSDKIKTDFTPMNVGAPVLIPQGNLDPNKGGS